MSGKWITARQLEIYMMSRMQKHTQSLSAAKAGISERSGRKIEHGNRVDRKFINRPWRTRPDPLEKVWESELVPLLEQCPALQAITLLEHIQVRYPGAYPDKILRTLQRRTKQWQALLGPPKEVMFRQTHAAGHQGLSDFTQLKKVTILIQGEPFKHLLYHFRLAFSHWSYMKVIEGGESFTALAEGLQEALQRLGGAPLQHRTDSLSAAFKNLGHDETLDITARYKALCSHYKMIPTRNNRGQGHENGSVESAHGHLKKRIQQALILRGNNNFPSVQSYQHFINDVVVQHNCRNAKALAEERSTLQPLPHYRTTDYTELSVVVSSASTIDVRRVTYTVPSRLQGEILHVHLYDNRLRCHLGHVHVIELKRLYPKGNTRARLVDYRHVIYSLIKKPQAFRHSALREELLPSVEFHAIWQILDAQLPPKEACKIIVGLLHISALHDCEEALVSVVMKSLEQHQPIVLSQLQSLFNKSSVTIPKVTVVQHTLAYYDQCIPQWQEVSHV